MPRSKWFRLELALLWVVFSFSAGYLLAKRFEPYQPGGLQFHRRSTLGAIAPGGRP